MNQLKTVIYKLTYMERVNGADTIDSMIGPKLYSNPEDALQDLWSYVKGRILACCPDLFSEWAYSDLFGFSTNFKSFEECDSDVRAALEFVNLSDVTKIADWYFDFSNDEQCDAFYQIGYDVVCIQSAVIELSSNSEHPVMHGTLTTDPCGLNISIQGYTDNTSQDDAGSIIQVENCEGEACVRLWSDIDSEDPTHSVEFSGARNESRNKN